MRTICSEPARLGYYYSPCQPMRWQLPKQVLKN